MHETNYFTLLERPSFAYMTLISIFHNYQVERCHSIELYLKLSFSSQCYCLEATITFVANLSFLHQGVVNWTIRNIVTKRAPIIEPQWIWTFKCLSSINNRQTRSCNSHFPMLYTQLRHEIQGWLPMHIHFKRLNPWATIWSPKSSKVIAPTRFGVHILLHESQLIPIFSLFLSPCTF